MSVEDKLRMKFEVEAGLGVDFKANPQASLMFIDVH
jgi:hypothetical protein